MRAAWMSILLFSVSAAVASPEYIWFAGHLAFAIECELDEEGKQKDCKSDAMAKANSVEVLLAESSHTSNLPWLVISNKSIESAKRVNGFPAWLLLEGTSVTLVPAESKRESRVELDRRDNLVWMRNFKNSQGDDLRKPFDWEMKDGVEAVVHLRDGKLEAWDKTTQIQFVSNDQLCGYATDKTVNVTELVWFSGDIKRIDFMDHMAVPRRIALADGDHVLILNRPAFPTSHAHFGDYFKLTEKGKAGEECQMKKVSSSADPPALIPEPFWKIVSNNDVFCPPVVLEKPPRP